MTRTTLIRTDRYSWDAIWLHWSIAALVLVNLALGLFHESLLDGIKWVIPIPPLPISGAAATLGNNLRGIVAYVMLALVVLHIAAALRHHLLLHDTVLGRMAPGWIRNG